METAEGHVETPSSLLFKYRCVHTDKETIDGY